MQFIKNVQNFASQYELWGKGSKIIVGVSGGPDSACLLNVFFILSKKYDFKLQIAHLNYRLRGQDSTDDENFVKELGKKYKLEVHILRPNKKLYVGNLESKLRDIRYEYFEKIRKELAFDFVAVAHNQNDQAETVLMRIIRGTGLNGLGAMRPKAENIIRPLLNVGRTEIIAYLKENKLIYRIDKSNEETDFLRNKIRHKLLPYLKDEFNPSIVKTISEMAYPVACDYDFILKNSESFVRAVCKNKKAAFVADVFLSLHESLQRQILRGFFEKLCGQVKDIEYKQIEEIRKIIKSDKNKAKMAVIGGLSVSKKGVRIEIFC